MRISEYEFQLAKRLASQLGCTQAEAVELGIRTLLDLLRQTDRQSADAIIYESFVALIEDSRRIKSACTMLSVDPQTRVQLEGRAYDLLNREPAKDAPAAQSRRNPKRLSHKPFAALDKLATQLTREVDAGSKKKTD